MSCYDSQRYLGENGIISRDKIFEYQCCQFPTRKKNTNKKTLMQLQDQRIYFTVSKLFCQLNSYSISYLHCMILTFLIVVERQGDKHGFLALRRV